MEYRMADDPTNLLQCPNVLQKERPVFTKSPFQPFTLESLIKFIQQSSYLYDSTNPLFTSQRIRVARWHEIGSYFGLSGETVLRHWLKTVCHYKYVLRKILVAKFRNEPQINAPGLWFDKIGSMIGVTFDQAMTQLHSSESLEDCLHNILLPTSDLNLEGESDSVEETKEILSEVNRKVDEVTATSSKAIIM